MDFALTYGLSKIFNIEGLSQNPSNIFSIIGLIIFSSIMFLKFLYKIFVYAYLLGTIAPTSEA